MRIEHEAWILVADGRRALLLRNEGDALYPNLKVETVLEDAPNPPTREHGSDKPGRAQESATMRSSAMEQTDWHDMEEQRFAATVAERVADLCRAGTIGKLIVAAAPRTLANLRGAFAEPVKQAIIAEFDKDLTRHPVPEIEKVLTAA